MAHLYTADLHLGHTRILTFCKRPFASIEEMDGRLLRAMQEAMGPDDDLWIVGDFAVATSDQSGRLEGMLASIPGRKHLVVGNHDPLWVTELTGWASTHDMVEIQDQGTRIHLCHYPMITFPGARHDGLQLFGHVHGHWLGSRNSINTGVDCWNWSASGSQPRLA